MRGPVLEFVGRPAPFHSIRADLTGYPERLVWWTHYIGNRFFRDLLRDVMLLCVRW